jgi:hypothetical protein
MRRTVFLAGLAALAAVVLPVPSLADGRVGTDRRSAPRAPAASPSAPFMLGGVPCSLIPVPSAKDPAPLGSGQCPGVRPGGRVLTSVGDCTMNFLFRASDGTRYIGTAGHCADLGDDNTFENSDNAGNGRIERIWPWGNGPVANDVGGQRIGEFVYAIVYEPKDFALIRLDPGVQASPEMCHFGTPRGVYSTTEAAEAAVFLRYYGNGAGVSDLAPARTAVALGTPNPDHVFAAGLALPGDSGAGVMTTDGLAVGVLVTTGVSGLALERDHNRGPAPSDLPEVNEKGVDFGAMGITRLGPQLARASEKLGVSLELITTG